jgi:putative phosphoribosyl transferase
MADTVSIQSEVEFEVDGRLLKGILGHPRDACGLVLFAHGSGSGRHSERNQYVATVLQDSGIATLLFDLLTEEEEDSERRTRHLRFDIPMLAQRLLAATRWITDMGAFEDLPLGYFGASTGAAAALVAAAESGATGAHKIAAVVSRGGRPDLAGIALARVRAPTLLIVGGDDTEVIELNQMAMRQMMAEHELKIVPNASHLFAEPGTLQAAALLARDWFRTRLCRTGTQA